MGSVSFWQSEGGVFEANGARPPLRGAVEADVAIVGGGITGAATALWLAREGARVALVEGRRIAAGASGRNGGFLLSGTAETYAAAVKRYGREQTRRIWAFNVANHDAAAELVAELDGQGWPTGFRRTGSLRIAASEAEQAELGESLVLLREDGWEAEPVAREELPPSLRATYVGATFYPRDGEIQPARFVRGIARLAEHAGAAIYEDSPVTEVTPGGAGWTVRTVAGKVHAPKVVLATNAWLQELGRRLGVGWLAGVVAPTRGQMLATTPVAERLFDCPCYADQGYQYWRQLPDGRLVIGGWRNTSFATENTDDETPNPAVQDRLEEFARGTLGLADVRIEQRWAGIMAFSRDGLPLIGAIPELDGCYVAAGYTGHGNAYAVRAGQVVAALALGRSHADAALFDPARFAPGESKQTPARSAAGLSGEGA